MDFFAETFDKAKEWFSVARQKGEEAVSIGKQKIEVITLQNKLNKLYARLGKNLFENLENEDDLPPQTAAIIKEIKEIRELLLSSEENY